MKIWRDYPDCKMSMCQFNLRHNQHCLSVVAAIHWMPGFPIHLDRCENVPDAAMLAWLRTKNWRINKAGYKSLLAAKRRARTLASRILKMLQRSCHILEAQGTDPWKAHGLQGTIVNPPVYGECSLDAIHRLRKKRQTEDCTTPE